jgi:Cu-Zn family superoxide dismutase
MPHTQITRIIVFLSLSLTIVSQSCSCKHSLSKEPGRSAICLLKPEDNSGVRGIVTMHQKNILYPVYYEFTVGGLGLETYHGVHIHEYGDLTEGCKSAGKHFNPNQKTHGGLKDNNRHVGDLGNLYSSHDGASKMCIVDRVSTLYGEKSIIGRSVVVHQNKDDLGRGGDEESARTGNAGPRIACGVIGVTN